MQDTICSSSGLECCSESHKASLISTVYFYHKVADSIVSKARQTLDRAIRLVNSTKKWNAKVVYGDTDSLFILLKGATKDQAFKIGREIVDQVTAANPKPVKLKFEKVRLYTVCVCL